MRDKFITRNDLDLALANRGGGGSVDVTDVVYYGDTEEITATVSLIDMFYPVGTVYVASSSSFDPNTQWGGTWVLFDKEFPSSRGTRIYDFSLNNAQDAVVYVSKSGHSVAIEITVYPNVVLSDTNVSLLTIDYNALGFTRIGNTCRSVGSSDDGNAVFAYELGYQNGALTAMDVVSKTSGGSIASGTRLEAYVVVNIAYNDMLDSFCDKFYWRRTA